ncbi:hypothetical protein [Mycobacterium sp. OAE908]|uniref:ATP-dependent DNA ligase n=1 Tax=Mycobacterium sp. OAE908 TaxID=2817899 RepID=UPI001AE9468D
MPGAQPGVALTGSVHRRFGVGTDHQREGVEGGVDGQRGEIALTDRLGAAALRDVVAAAAGLGGPFSALSGQPVTLTPVIPAGSSPGSRVRSAGLEGLVCKRASSTYQPGRRSNVWIKSVVRHRAPMVVGGWVAGRSGTLGSLLVGAHDAVGQFVYCGHVGFGFTGQLRHQ